MTEIALALIAIVSSVVSAIIARMKSQREDRQSDENELQKRYYAKEDELIQILKSRESQQAQSLEKVLGKLDSVERDIRSISNRLDVHIRQSVAIDRAIIQSIKGVQPNGELTFAEKMLEMETKG